MAEFGGYDMPLWYPAGARSEHLAVLTGCGVFDTSHMSVISLTGPDILELLQWCFSRDLDRCVYNNRYPLTPGRCTYGVFLNEAGGLVDDVILFQLDVDLYLAVVNAGMGAHTTNHILNYIDTCEGSCKVIVSDLSDRIGKIDIQGPLAGRVMREVIQDPYNVFADMPYFSFKGSFYENSGSTGKVLLRDGTPVLLSRSGYTGEFGFEVFINPENLVDAWTMILEAGERYGITTCGLASRDSLRAGAVMPLSHQDNGNWRYLGNPWSVALPYNEDGTSFTKVFLGSKALASSPPSYYTYPFVGYDPRKVIADGSPPLVIDGTGKVIGIVLTCATEIGIDRRDGSIFSVSSPNKPDDFAPRGLSCGFIKVNRELADGTTVTLKDAKRSIPVVVTDDIRPARTARLPLAVMMDVRT